MDNIVTIIILVLIILGDVLAAVILISRKKDMQDDRTAEGLARLEDGISSSNSALRQELSANVTSTVKALGDMVLDAQKTASAVQYQRLNDMDLAISAKQILMSEAMQNQLKQLEERIKTLESGNEQKLSEMRDTISKRLSYIQEDNNKRLDEIRVTVDEKLQKTLDEKMTNSFKMVSERLEQVYKGLGEMDADQLWETTLNPKTRILKQVEIEDARMASDVTELLMGTDVPPRKSFIYQHAHDAELDI